MKQNAPPVRATILYIDMVVVKGEHVKLQEEGKENEISEPVNHFSIGQQKTAGSLMPKKEIYKVQAYPTHHCLIFLYPTCFILKYHKR